MPATAAGGGDTDEHGEAEVTAVPEDVEATDAMPSPIPMRVKAGSNTLPYASAPPVRTSTTAPAATRTRPELIPVRAPTRAASRGPANDPAMTATLKGAHRRPVSRAPSPSTACGTRIRVARHAAR